ncbi:MAG TPA: hypothetical protein EYG80_06600 [Flavobacteriaceae bacterium]|nr:hypothetical protein [Flavobacteriaceae bacterium]
MKPILKIYFTISFIILFLLICSIVFFKQETKSDNLEALKKIVLDDVEKVLTFEKENLLIFALALSENGALKKTLYDGDFNLAYNLLDDIADKFTSNELMKKLRLQVLSNDFKIFAQNWKQNTTGISLSSFRTDLEKLKNNKVPQVGIEVGRRLTFKATIPIKYKKNYIGYLEVIKFVDEFAEKLRSQGIELIVLMKPKYVLEKNSLMDKFSRFKGYVIANENYNSQLIDKASSLEWKKLKSLSYYEHEEMLFILKSMVNGEGDEIGKYLIVLPKDTFKKYQNGQNNISFFTRFSDEDIYNFVKYWENPAGSYQNIDDRNLLHLYSNLGDKERHYLKHEIEKRLSKYTNDELINIILEERYKEKKIGVVE